MTELQDRIRSVITDLAPGEIVSYGEVARRAGRRGAARAVGAFLAEFGGDLRGGASCGQTGASPSANRSGRPASCAPKGST